MSDWTTKPRTPRATDWTPEQLDILRHMAGHAPAAEIAAAVGRKVKAVQAKASALNLSLAFAKTHAPWLAREVAALRGMAGTHTIAQAAARLGRPRLSVREKAVRERISFGKYGDRHHSTRFKRSELQQIYTLSLEGMTTREIAARVGMSQTHVSHCLSFRERWRDMQKIVGQ